MLLLGAATRPARTGGSIRTASFATIRRVTKKAENAVTMMVARTLLAVIPTQNAKVVGGNMRDDF